MVRDVPSVIWAARGDFPGLLYLAALVLGVLGIQGFILALVGEYLGRIQRDVEGRPLYAVERELEPTAAALTQPEPAASPRSG